MLKFLWCPAVLGLGIVQHVELCLRVMPYVGINASEEPYFLGGCAFPDWEYYGIEKDRPIHSDLAHQPQFIDSFNMDNVKVRAFVRGVKAHQEADRWWHGDAGDGASPIHMIAHTCLGGSYMQAHQPLEALCDVMGPYSRPFEQVRLEFPLTAVVEAYSRLGYPVTKLRMLKALVEAYREYVGRRFASEWLFRRYAPLMPVALDQIADYLPGGLRHLEFQIQLALNRK